MTEFLVIYAIVAGAKLLMLCLWFSDRTVLSDSDYRALALVSLAWPLVVPMYLIGCLVYGGGRR